MKTWLVKIGSPPLDKTVRVVANTREMALKLGLYWLRILYPRLYSQRRKLGIEVVLTGAEPQG